MTQISRTPTAEEIEFVKNVKPYEFRSSRCIYDVFLPSADDPSINLLEQQRGKVTLLFNVAAGCGNIPQHEHLETIRQLYVDCPDFSIIAVVVDDFTCHGYSEFNRGLEHYAKQNNLELTAGQVSKKYAMENFNVTFEFSELTNGRIDKHKYDSTWIPNDTLEQEIHPLWAILTEYDTADIRPDGIPYHREYVPWVNLPHGSEKNRVYKPVKATFPLSGNFTKFLIDRTGHNIKRFGNGFLLGERDASGAPFPWWPEGLTEDGKPSHLPRTLDPNGRDDENKKFGIELSIEVMSSHIDQFLSGTQGEA